MLAQLGTIVLSIETSALMARCEHYFNLATELGAADTIIWSFMILVFTIICIQYARYIYYLYIVDIIIFYIISVIIV